MKLFSIVVIFTAILTSNMRYFFVASPVDLQVQQSIVEHKDEHYNEALFDSSNDETTVNETTSTEQHETSAITKQSDENTNKASNQKDTQTEREEPVVTVDEQMFEPESNVVDEDVVVCNSDIATDLFELINLYRVESGLAELQFTELQYSHASALAQKKAENDMVGFSHYANQLSILYDQGRAPVAKELLQQWIDSPSHNEFLLSNRRYGAISIYSKGTTYYVIMSAKINNQ